MFRKHIVHVHVQSEWQTDVWLFTLCKMELHQHPEKLVNYKSLICASDWAEADTCLRDKD